MSKNVRYLWILVGTFFVAALIFVFLPFWVIKDDFKGLIANRADADLWMQALVEIERTWKLGPHHEKVAELNQNCQDILGDLSVTDTSTYLRCNPSLLACLARTQQTFGNANFKLAALSTDNKEKYYRLKRNESAQIVYEFKLVRTQNPHQYLNIELTPDCRQTYLPPRLYALGAPPKGVQRESFIWDNSKRHFFIDKDLVSVRDLKDFLEISTFKEYQNLLSATERASIQQMIEKNNLATPAITLTLSQQQKYCAVWGKQLLSAELYDAATFVPFTLEERYPAVISRSPYPWSKRKGGVFLSEPTAELTAEDCARAYVYECHSNFKRKHFEALSNSWIGLREILGGEMESVRNAHHPRKNLVVSSHYFSRTSNWHQLGLRGYWDGERHDYRNFNFGLSDPAEEFKESFGVGFRCVSQGSAE